MRRHADAGKLAATRCCCRSPLDGRSGRGRAGSGRARRRRFPGDGAGERQPDGRPLAGLPDAGHPRARLRWGGHLPISRPERPRGIHPDGAGSGRVHPPGPASAGAGKLRDPAGRGLGGDECPRRRFETNGRGLRVEGPGRHHRARAVPRVPADAPPALAAQRRGAAPLPGRDGRGAGAAAPGEGGLPAGGDRPGAGGHGRVDAAGAASPAGAARPAPRAVRHVREGAAAHRGAVGLRRADGPRSRPARRIEHHRRHRAGGRPRSRLRGGTLDRHDSGRAATGLEGAPGGGRPPIPGGPARRRPRRAAGGVPGLQPG